MGRCGLKMTPHLVASVIFVYGVVVAAHDDTSRDPKLGRPGWPDVKCGKWTNRVVYIGFNTVAVFEADRSTKRWSSPAPSCWWTTGTLTSAREAMHSLSKLMTQNQKGLVHQYRGGLPGAGQIQEPGGKLHCFLPQDLKYNNYINTWSYFLQLSNMCICPCLVQ